MKEIRARITMYLTIPDDEARALYESAKAYEREDGSWVINDIEVTGELLDKFRKEGKVDDGWEDSYIPGPWIEEEWEVE